MRLASPFVTCAIICTAARHSGYGNGDILVVLWWAYMLCLAHRFLCTRETQDSKVVLATTVLLGLNLVILPYLSLFALTKLKVQQAAFVIIGTEVCGLCCFGLVCLSYGMRGTLPTVTVKRWTGCFLAEACGCSISSVTFCTSCPDPAQHLYLFVPHMRAFSYCLTEQ